MKIPVRFALPVIASIALLIACQKQIHDALSPLPPEEIDNTDSFVDKSVKASFQGRVLNEEGQPLKGATVEAGGSTVLTDEYGIFFLSDVLVSEEFSYIQVEKAGYLLGSRALRAGKEAAGFVEIQLIKKELKGSFDAKSKASIKISEGTLVDFPERAIVLEDGTEYNGIVNVYGTLIDPSSSDFSRIMPGDLRGLRTDNSISALISYGMVTVKLEGEAGEKLQLASGKTATINMTISESLQSSAPQTIPMWHFIESTGIWKEDGKGVKVGNSYRGEVSHFSTWNFDVPANFVWLSLQLENESQTPVPYTAVHIYDSNGGGSTGHTDSLGKLKMWILKSTNLHLKVNGRCSPDLGNKQIGSFEADTDLGKIILESAQSVQISGYAVDCHDQPVINGTVRVLLQGLSFRAPIVNGEYIVNADMCTESSSAKIIAQHNDSLVSSDLRVIEVFRGVNQLEKLVVCSQSQTEQPENPETPETDFEQYVEYTIGDQTFRYTPLFDSVKFDFGGHRNWILASENKTAFPAGTNGIRYEMLDTIPRTYKDPNTMWIILNGIHYWASDSTTYNLIKFGQIGEAIEARFEGNLKSDSGVIKPVIGEVRVKRTK